MNGRRNIFTVTVGLASHWPRVTYRLQWFIHLYGLTAQGDEPTLLMGCGTLYLTSV